MSTPLQAYSNLKRLEYIMPPKNYHFITIATNIYDTFIPHLINSIQSAYRDMENTIHISIFSNKQIDLNNKYNFIINQYHIEHKPWPYPTLERYKTFLSIENKVDDNEFIIYTDADMLIKEKIPYSDSIKLFGVMHPGYYDKSRKPFISDKNSSVFIEKSKRINYLCGGIQGGRAKDFFKACHILAKSIEIDDKKNQIPKWHDESYWNYYYVNNNSDFTVLGPEYCWPEEWVTDLYPGKVIALTKSSAISGTKSFLTGIKATLGKAKRSIKKQGY